MSVVEAIPRIRKLPDAVANQIAAGEVIERPASVVKELIENSIDAASTKIQIDIEQSGLRLIRVTDNGQGIHKDDLKLALQPHATSKLASFSDLEQIVSLGFRGEAIPSIASVSHFTMTSRFSDAELAWSINNDLDIKPAAHAIGTTVEVSDLFFTTPGRRKFLKSERTEYLHIQSLIKAVALSHFSIGFFVKHNEQSLFRLPACINEPDKRVLNICGRTFMDKAMRVDIQQDGLHLWGWLGSAEIARSQSDRQYFFVNGRYVRDKHMMHAIRLAYAERIAPGRFPVFVLHLQIDPAMVDVNVHPAKSEVRFAKARDVHDVIYTALLEALNKPFIADLPAHTDNANETNDVSTANDMQGNYGDTLFRQTDLLDNEHKQIHYLKLFDGRYIISVINRAPYLIDVAKARALITANYLYTHYLSASITQRPIMVPIGIELEQKQIKFVLDNQDCITQWGFELEQITPDQILIRALPARLHNADAIALIKTLLDVLMLGQAHREVASHIANHVNDAGINYEHDVIIQLVNEISNYKADAEYSVALPWRELDSETLSSWLTA